jgi:hypothetical protein
MRVRLFALLVALSLVLSACSSDCVACRDVSTERPLQVVVNLCASEVPDPVAGEEICAEPATVSYKFVATGQ